MGTDPFNPESDGDSVLDGDEWIADTDPTDVNSYLGIRRIWMENATPAMMVEWEGGIEATQVLEYTTNIVTGTWEERLTYYPPTDMTNSYAVPYDELYYQYRIQAYR